MSRLDDERMYLLHSKMQGFKKRIEKAKKILKIALNQAKNPTLSFSAGKDSIVLLDMAIKCGFKGKIVFFKYGICNDIETPKENIKLLEYYTQKYDLQYEILNCLGEVDCWEMCNGFILRPETKEQKRIFNKTNYDFIEKSKMFDKLNHTDLSIIGMRKAESKNRQLILNMKGEIYITKYRGLITCCPLAGLTNEDIWAYIFLNRLKYLKIYDYEYIDRRYIRNEITLLYNDSILRNGMIFHYKQMYKDYFNWLTLKYGNILF